MTKLITKQPKRLFAFGCSFTEYFWSTWPEIIALELDIPFYNYGKSGGGNQYIANTISQADAIYNFNENDLIIVSWTNVCREDRWRQGGWVTPGNIFTQGYFDKEFIKNWADPIGYMVRDFASIRLIRNLLENKKCQYHMLSMCDISEHIEQGSSRTIEKESKEIHNKICNMYREDLNSIHPSFSKVLWDNDIYNNKLLKDVDVLGKYFSDGHPDPKDHFKYLQSIFKDYIFSENTKLIVDNAHQQYLNFIHKMNKKYQRNYAIYELEGKELKELKSITRIKEALPPDFI